MNHDNPIRDGGLHANWPEFVGRDRELAQLKLAIGPGDDGLRLVMLTGPSGIGKTTLASHAVEQATSTRFDVVVVSGRAGSLSAPFAPWLDAFPALVDSLETKSGNRAEIDQIGAALVAILAERTVAKPLLLVFDDAHALDQSSIALLPYCSGVSERMNLSLLLVEQSDIIGNVPSYPAYADGLLARRVVHHLELGPMSDESVSELVRAVLDLSDGESVPEEVVLRAQGNPWFAQELALAWRSGQAEIPVNIAAAATARLHSLTEPEQDLVNAIAISPEGAYIGWIEALTDQKPREFVRTMENIVASGLVREDGEILSIAHPLMQQSLEAEMSAAMRRALHIELADIIGTVPIAEITAERARGYHYGQAGRTEDAVAHLLAAAEANEALGQPHEAFADYERALEFESRIEHRIMILKRCGRAAGDAASERAADFYSELSRIASARSDHNLYAYAMCQQYWRSYDGVARDRLQRAADLGEDEFGWAARAASMLCNRNGDYQGQRDHSMRALELAREHDDAELVVFALQDLALARSWSGEIQEAIGDYEQLIQIASQQRFHEQAVIARGNVADLYIDNLATHRATVECNALVRYIDDLGIERYRCNANAALACALATAGNLQEALRVAENGLEVLRTSQVSYQRFLPVSARALVAIEMGDIQHGGTLVADAAALAAEDGWESYIVEATFDRARYLIIEGKLDEAFGFAGSLDIDEPSTMARIAQWFVRIGYWFDRTDYVDQGKAIRDRVEPNVPLVALIWDEIDAMMELAGGSVDAIQDVSKRWADAGRPLDSLRTSVAQGLALRAKTPADSIALLTEVRKQFAEIGAAWDADFVANVLRGLGTRSRAKSRSTNVGNLTKRELEIARLVASGLRNAEVAQKLFLAEKTVAAHLSNIYGKLEIRSRVQLSAWLAENDETAELQSA